MMRQKNQQALRNTEEPRDVTLLVENTLFSFLSESLNFKSREQVGGAPSGKYGLEEKYTWNWPHQMGVSPSRSAIRTRGYIRPSVFCPSNL